jgi:glycine C-acetyltransferase
LGFLDVIVKAKKEFNFRLRVDDAHGFGTMGPGGRGTAAHFGVVDGVDVLFNTFAMSMAGIGAFVSGPRWLINLFRYNMRSQLYAKSLPMPMVIGALKRLELIRNHPEYQEKLWEITRAIQNGFKENGFEIGVTQSPVTPVYMKGGNEEGTNLIVDLRENYGIFCSIVIYPVIPKGEIILRIIPTAAHTMEDVERTIAAFKAVRDKFEAGYYRSMPIPMKADPEFKLK